METQEVCANSPIPTGWIKTSDDWDPNCCGNPAEDTLNVWKLTRYDDLPVDSELEVCVSMPTPHGWVTEDYFWQSTGCGKPVNHVNNMKRIRRVS